MATSLRAHGVPKDGQADGRRRLTCVWQTAVLEFTRPLTSGVVSRVCTLAARLLCYESQVPSNSARQMRSAEGAEMREEGKGGMDRGRQLSQTDELWPFLVRLSKSGSSK